VTRVHPKYAIERLLGGGGMAEVFLAQVSGAEGFTRRVAIKRILPRFSQDAEFARLFVSEAQLTSRLQHPNLVSVMDFDRDDHGRLFLVMELVDGVDLDRLLDTGPLSLPLIIYLAIEILSGLRYAHDLPLHAGAGVRGIVHRDISPHNVLLSWEGAVKVSDFGIAKSRAFSHAAVTAVVKGKPAYMSPEQANGDPLDGRSDLFSVGVMLWEMLCAQPLFSGSTARETIGRMLYGPIPSPSDVRPDVPADLSRVVLRLLTRDRAQRTPNADAAITELVACADHPRNGREVLIRTLAERFAGRAARHAHRVARAAPARVTTSRSGPRALAGGGPETLTAAPGVVLDPIAPPVPRSRRPRRQRGWIVLTSVAVAGSLVGGGLALYLARPDSLPPATDTRSGAGGAGPSTEPRPDHGPSTTPLPGSPRSRSGLNAQGSGSDAIHELGDARPPRT
jgi:hypothetical protein